MASTEETPGPPRRAAPPRRRRWRRRVATAFLALVAIVGFAPFALSIAAVRRFVAEQVSVAIGRRVTIGGLTARWWSGVEMRDVEVHNPEGFVGEPLLVVDRVRADVSVLRLAAGRIDADVSLERPVLTLFQGPSGAWNSEGVLRDLKDEREGKKARDPPAVRLRVARGRWIARGKQEATSGDVDDMDLDLRLGSDGSRRLFLEAVARGAGSGGADAVIQARVDLDATGAGTVRAVVPRLNLARLSGLVGSAVRADAASGAVSAEADLRIERDGEVGGSAKIDLDQVSLWIRDGLLALRSGSLRIEPSRTGGDPRFSVALDLDDLRATGFPTEGESMSEPRIEAKGVVTRRQDGAWILGEDGAPFSVDGRTFSATASGSLATSLRVGLRAEALTVGSRLRPLLGADYSDLGVEGPLVATVVLGRAADGGLTLDAEATLPRLSSGGLAIAEGRVSAKRSAAAAPLLVVATGRVNGGTLSANARCELDREGRPWSGRAEIRGLDTSPLVVGKGPGRFLPLLLPAIVAAGATGPSLSGRLDADLSLEAYAPGAVSFVGALKGSGRLDMGQGTVRESTLFAGLGGGAGGQGLGRLVSLVPGLGERLGALARSVLFSELASRFEVGGRAIRLLEVRMTSDAVTLRFSGTVGFDGSLDLTVPVTLRGDVGRSAARFLKDGVLPVRVVGRVGALRVTPDVRNLALSDEVVGDLLKKAGDLFGR